MRVLPWIVAALVSAGPPPARAQSDLLFSTGHLDTTPSGTTLLYRQDTSFAGGGTLPERHRQISLTVDGADADGQRPVEIVLDPAGQAQRLDTFRGVPGNPMLMIFLESVVSAVSAATGGSPFYLRNRMREALGDRLTAATDPGGSPDARILSVRPFASDPNQSRLGVFASLELQFVFDPSAPGMLSRMTALAGDPAAPAYREEIRLDGGT